MARRGALVDRTAESELARFFLADVITPLTRLVAVPEPAAFSAVTTTLRVRPTSDAVSP
jgi:hypothetical protein